MLKSRLDALALILINQMFPDNSPSNALEKKARKALRAFTLAELLISLAILGVIATFSIPKILVAQQNERYNAAAKELVSMVSAAYQQAQLDGIVSSNTQMRDLLPYLNYVQIDTSATINDRNGQGTQNCSNVMWTCIKLHNGGIAWTAANAPPVSFNGTSALNFIWVNFDPDPSTDIAGSGVSFGLYYNGQITTYDNLKPSSTNSLGTQGAEPNTTPSWFHW